MLKHTHSYYCLLSGLQAITSLVCGRCNKLVSSALCSNNSIVRMVNSVALNDCRNFVGYNRRYGYQSVRHYSVQDVTSSLLINKLKSSVFVPGFLPWELHTLLHQACTRLFTLIIVICFCKSTCMHLVWCYFNNNNSNNKFVAI